MKKSQYSVIFKTIISDAQDIYSIFPAVKETKRFFVCANEARTVLTLEGYSSVEIKLFISPLAHE